MQSAQQVLSSEVLDKVKSNAWDGVVELDLILELFLVKSRDFLFQAI